MSDTAQSVEHQPHLIRALGRRDLVLLFVVAVFNLNVVPSIAANGGATVWLWIISLLLFFWPQGIAVIASLTLLALLTLFNILGLGVGKWINNLGAIGTFIAAAVLIGLGAVIWSRFGTTITRADFAIPANPKFVLNSFGVICFGLVGLELASVMGDEIKDPGRTLPGAVAWGGVLSGALYIGATLTLLIAVGKNVNVLQGIVQAVTHMAERVGVGWVSIPFAVLLSLSIAGIGSAWTGGSARIPFVAGLDSYMPSWLGKVHPRYATPYAALIVQGIVSGLLVLGNFYGWWFWDKIAGFLNLLPRLYLSPAG